MHDEWTWKHNDYVSAGSATTDRHQADRDAESVRRHHPDDDLVTVVHRVVSEWAVDQRSLDLSKVTEAYGLVIEAIPPSSRLQRLHELRTAADQAVRAQVIELMTDGWTWTGIGELLGISRQAAAKRFGPDVERARV